MTQSGQPDQEPDREPAADPSDLVCAELDQLAAESRSWLALSPAEALIRLTAVHTQLHAALAGLDRI